MNPRHSLRSWLLWTRFSRISLLCSVHLPPSLLPDSEKHLHSMMLPPPLRQYCTGSSGNEAWKRGLSEQIILLFSVWKSFRCVFVISCVMHFHLAALPKSSDWWSVRARLSSHLQTWSLELKQSDHQGLGYLSYSYLPVAQLGFSKLLTFKNYGGHRVLENLQCSRIFFVVFYRSVSQFLLCHYGMWSVDWKNNLKHLSTRLQKIKKIK